MRFIIPLALMTACAADPDGPTKTPGDGRPAGDSASGGDNAGPGDPVVASVAAEDMCTWITEVFCAAEQECCTDAAHRYAAYDQCVAAELSDCESELSPIFTDPRTGYDADIAGDRVTAMRIKASNCEAGVGAWSISDDGLYGALLGTVGPGGDCSPESTGDLAIAAACSGDNVCKLTSIVIAFEGECEAASGLNGGCYTDLECEADLHCDPENNWLKGGGNCVARFADGQVCEEAGVAVDGACLSLHCDAASGLCAPATVNKAYCLLE